MAPPSTLAATTPRPLHTLSPFARFAAPALRGSGTAWLVVALLGQAMFAVYVAGFYGAAALQGRLADWTKVLSKGWVPGDAVGNAVLAAHLLFTVVVVVGGALQLLPALRRHAPAVHRWNGRVYVLSALVLAIGGIVMIVTRGTVGGPAQHLATILNGVVIVACAALAWRAARARRFDAHRRWALRLFLVVSGVWFFRVGLMAWLVIHRAPVGFDPDTFTGPFLVFLAFAQWMLPLAVLELYLRVQRSGGPAAQAAVAVLMVALTLLTALGIGTASMMMWLPRL